MGFQEGGGAKLAKPVCAITSLTLPLRSISCKVGQGVFTFNSWIEKGISLGRVMLSLQGKLHMLKEPLSKNV